MIITSKYIALRILVPSKSPANPLPKRDFLCRATNFKIVDL